MKFRFDRLAHNPADAEQLACLHQRRGAPYLQHKEDALLGELVARFADLQLLVRSGGDMIGATLLLPFRWNGALENLPVSLEDLLIRAIGCRELKTSANTLACLAVVTTEANGGNGLRADILAALNHWAGNQGFTSLMALLRPTRKAEHPLTPMGEYMNWRQTDGRAFDPELRMHSDLGASVLGIMPQAMTVEANLSAWEGWTGTSFSQSGEYILADSLKPVLIDCENDYGLYEEAHVWVRHRPASALLESDSGSINHLRTQPTTFHRHRTSA